MSSSVIALWVVLAGIAAWGAFHFARRDPRSTSLMKLTFAGALLAMFGLALGILKLPPEMIGEGLLAHAMLFIFWSMAAVGAPLCVGYIIGILIGLRSLHDYAS